MFIVPNHCSTRDNTSNIVACSICDNVTDMNDARSLLRAGLLPPPPRRSKAQMAEAKRDLLLEFGCVPSRQAAAAMLKLRPVTCLSPQELERRLVAMRLRDTTLTAKRTDLLKIDVKGRLIPRLLFLQRSGCAPSIIWEQLHHDDMRWPTYHAYWSFPVSASEASAVFACRPLIKNKIAVFIHKRF